MKNKKLTYILLPAVLAIWGIIFYRIFNAVGGNDGNNASNDPGTEAAQVRSYTDTFSIAAVYRDPFLGKLAVENRPRTSVSAPSKPVEPKPQPVQAPWPTVGYSGMIKNQKSSVQLAMLQVNGQSYMLKVGQAVEGIQILKIYRDSVEIGFQKERRTIRK